MAGSGCGGPGSGPADERRGACSPEGGCGVCKDSSRPGPAPPAQVALPRKAATSLPGWASLSYPPTGDPRDA